MKQSEFYAEVARVCKLAEDSGCNELVKYKGELYSNVVFSFYYTIHEHCTFAIAVVEGKAVFDGDELYNIYTGYKFTVVSGSTSNWHKFSWNPPKQKTVMVELTYEHVKTIIESGIRSQLSEACRKALSKENEK